MGEQQQRAELERVAAQGIRALILLTGGDPDAPYLADTPARLTTALTMIGTDHGVTEPRMAATLSVCGPDPRLLLTMGLCPPPDDPEPDGGPTGPLLTGPTPAQALCADHLLPFRLELYTAHVPDHGHRGERPALVQFGSFARWFCQGPTTPHRVVHQAAEAMRQALNGRGGAVLARVTAPCPLLHEPADALAGIVDAGSSWGIYSPGAAEGSGYRAKFVRFTHAERG